jgi:hypothetical protein
MNTRERRSRCYYQSDTIENVLDTRGFGSPFGASAGAAELDSASENFVTFCNIENLKIIIIMKLQSRMYD